MSFVEYYLQSFDARHLSSLVPTVLVSTPSSTATDEETAATAPTNRIVVRSIRCTF